MGQELGQAIGNHHSPRNLVETQRRVLWRPSRRLTPGGFRPGDFPHVVISPKPQPGESCSFERCGRREPAEKARMRVSSCTLRLRSVVTVPLVFATEGGSTCPCHRTRGRLAAERGGKLAACWRGEASRGHEAR